jgi:signal transduction histidine kinase
MAQDLHDVLAHQIALITVQANAGLAMLYRQPDRTGESLQAIKQTGNSALAELRGVLDTLRAGSPEGSAEVAPPGAGRAPRGPTHPTAVSGRRHPGADRRGPAVGLTVSYDDRGLGGPLPVTVDSAAYRVVQEGLTNAVRHAGPGSSVVVAVARADGTLLIEVVDDGRGAPLPAAARGGQGLPGMTERVGALGGILRAGPRPGGGFAITARIPLGGRL